MHPDVPQWARDVSSRVSGVEHEHISRFAPAPDHARAAAVLVVLRDRGYGPETVLVTRSSRLRAHAGQVAFPGGAVDDDDSGPIATALRETSEETTLNPQHLHPLCIWPSLWIPVSGFAVTPVFAWCADDADVNGREDDTEVVSAHAVTFAAAAAPTARTMVRYPNGATGPAFDIDGLFVWGFTGLVLDRILHFVGWEQPWQPSNVVDLPGTTPTPPDSLGPRDSAVGGVA